MEVITNQLKVGEDVQMDFTMNELKPHIYEWFYIVWINIKSRITMVLKS